ncbi:hypothetical protein ACWGCW_01125 [Streptomyces sp. NPDC054933]
MALVIGEIKAGFVADDRANGTLIPLPPQNGGAVGWGPVYLSFGCDFSDVLLRVAVYNSKTKAWRIMDKLPVPVLGDRVGVQIQDGDQKVSVGRVQNGAADKGTAPCSYLLETTLKAA